MYIFQKYTVEKVWHIKLLLLLLAILFAILSCIKAPDYAYESGAIFFQHLGTLLLLLPLMLELKQQRMSIIACCCLFLFTCLHILGARYLYSYVPYDQWAKSFLNININMDEIHGNKFDRLVHFAFGFLLFPLFFQAAKRIMKGGTLWTAILFAWLVIQTFSMIYEIFEWLLTKIAAGDFADNYNGQQGDMWDAQKDMAQALIGSTLSALLTYFACKKSSSNEAEAENDNVRKQKNRLKVEK